jgi:hypothetical protein
MPFLASGFCFICSGYYKGWTVIRMKNDWKQIFASTAESLP